jgi:signal transduction histidine kinase
MINELDIIKLLLLFVATINIVLATVIFSRTIKNIADVMFGLIAVACMLWSFSIMGFYSHLYSEFVNWIQMTHITAISIPLFFVIFSINFPQKLSRKKLPVILPLISLICISIVIYFTDLVISPVGDIEYKINSGYMIYSFLMIAYFATGFLFMFKQYRLAQTIIHKKQVVYVAIGSLIASFLALITDLIMPYIGIFEYTWLGPLFTLVMVGSIFMAMIKYSLFNIRLIITEAISALIVLVLIAELFFVDSVTELFLKSLILIIVTIFSYLLIKSVYREIEQKEHIEILAIDLKKANERLTELDRQKSEFVSFATHQLRAPLTAMKGYASLILEGDMGDISEKAKVAVGRIFESTNTLTSIVDDYLNITRIELGSMKYAFETIDFKQLVEDVIAEIKPNIEKTGLAFNFKYEGQGIDFRITADRDKLKQVIANLIDNSLKYTPKGSINVSLKLDRSSHKFIFEINDTGVGIAAETIPRLFQKFSRADNANKTNIRGTGLGLYVAREIVNAHHGEIKVSSPGEGKGSTFTVEIEPFAKA